MILRLGKRYINRRGRIIGPLRRSSDPKRGYTCGIRNYTLDGRWNGSVETEHDLTTEVP